MPKVSVIMASYNAAQFIECAISSVMNQTFSDLELVVVDDASRDESLHLAQKAALMDPRIKVWSLTQNVGAGAARNIAIEKAKGEWLAILDADDVFLVDKIERQLELLNKVEANVVLIASNSFEIDGNGKRFSLQKYPVTDDGLKSNIRRLKRFPPHSSMMYKADIVRSVGGFSNRYRRAEDYDLWLRLYHMGSFALVSAPLVEYRHHKTNISKTNSGLDQLKYGVACVTCFCIRERNGIDPSQYSSDDEWNAFLSWIADRIEESGLLEYLTTRAEWRKVFRERRNSAIGLFKLLGLMSQEPAFVWREARMKTFGSYLPQQLANEWTNSHVRFGRYRS